MRNSHKEANLNLNNSARIKRYSYEQLFKEHMVGENKKMHFKFPIQV